MDPGKPQKRTMEDIFTLEKILIWHLKLFVEVTALPTGKSLKNAKLSAGLLKATVCSC